MSSSEDTIARAAAERGPSEWQLALDRYEQGYGEPFDWTDPVARVVFLQLLRDEVARAQRIGEAETIAFFEAATARIRRGLRE